MAASTSAQAQGPPYIPHTVAMAGGYPTISLDVPICAVLLAIYTLGAVSHMTIFQLNRRRGHKFYMSWAMFGFCMARIMTFILRLVLAFRLTNGSLIIASLIFSGAGVLVAYLVTLLLSLRLLRATHPELGWKPWLRLALKIAYVGLGVAFAFTIGFTVTSFYTQKVGLRKAATWVQRVAILYMLLFNITSLVFLSLTILLPPSLKSENFGTRSIRYKISIISTSLFFCLFIIGYRFGVTWADPRPISDPAWYQSKPAFYIIEYVLELPIIFGALIIRFDKVFWVPNGSCKPGDYSKVEDKQLEVTPDIETGDKQFEAIPDVDAEATLKEIGADIEKPKETETVPVTTPSDK